MNESNQPDSMEFDKKKALKSIESTQSLPGASVTIRFTDSTWEAATIAKGSNLATCLDAKNSPLLFGCRTGICATCLVRVHSDKPLPPPQTEEVEVLQALDLSPDSDYRLACQIEAMSDMVLEIAEEA